MRKQQNNKGRLGAAMVEMAVCLPVFVLLVWGTVQLNEAIYQKQILTSAAHEGTLLGMRQLANSAEVRNRVVSVLEARGVEDFTVTIDGGGGDIVNLEPGSLFTVRVSTQGNSYLNLDSLGVDVVGQRP